LLNVRAAVLGVEQLESMGAFWAFELRGRIDRANRESKTGLGNIANFQEWDEEVLGAA
jgi:hypothetical protein